MPIGDRVRDDAGDGGLADQDWAFAHLQGRADGDAVPAFDREREDADRPGRAGREFLRVDELDGAADQGMTHLAGQPPVRPVSRSDRGPPAAVFRAAHGQFGLDDGGHVARYLCTVVRCGIRPFVRDAEHEDGVRVGAVDDPVPSIPDGPGLGTEPRGAAIDTREAPPGVQGIGDPGVIPLGLLFSPVQKP